MIIWKKNRNIRLICSLFCNCVLCVIGIWGVINSIPNHHWDCRWWEGERTGKYLSAVLETSHTLLLLSDLSTAHFSITTEVVKRNDWCSGLRKRSQGSVTYHRLATVQWSLHMSSVRECSWYDIRRRMSLDCGDSLLCV